MFVLVVGGDRLGCIPGNLKNLGFTKIKHLSGRKKNHLKFDIPSQASIILVLTDYVNHRLAAQIKERARKKGVKVVFARRAWSHILGALALEAKLQKSCKKEE